MRKLWPFLGIAIAVAAGVAFAPYFWRVLGVAGVILLAWLLLGVGWIIWQAIKRHVSAWIGLDPP